MYRNELQDDEDLRVEIFHLKKQLSTVNAENHLLKVKIRKLQNEVVKKDRQMDVVLDPRKSPDVRKILYERSASFVLNMKEQNDELLDLLHEKDIIIRRLQNQLDVAKLYSQHPKKQFQCKSISHLDLDNKIRQVQLKIPCFKNGTISSTTIENNGKRRNKNLSWTSGLQEADSTLMEDVDEISEDNSGNKNKDTQCNTYDIKEQYKSLSRDHLLSIIENLKNNQRSPSSRQTSSRKSSPESDLERIELFCESPHEEIQQLHLHFLDMISEVDHLKSTITQLQNSQEKTHNVLKKKNTNIDKLAQEIKNLKRPKPKTKPNKNRRCFSSADLVAKIYSENDNKNKVCAKYEKELKSNNNDKTNSNREKRHRNNKSSAGKHKNVRGKQEVRDVMVQVENLDSPGSPNQCLYIEKSSITIKQKTSSAPNTKDDDYGDEVFEECDEEESVVC